MVIVFNPDPGEHASDDGIDQVVNRFVVMKKGGYGWEEDRNSWRFGKARGIAE